MEKDRKFEKNQFSNINREEDIKFDRITDSRLLIAEKDRKRREDSRGMENSAEKNRFSIETAQRIERMGKNRVKIQIFDGGRCLGRAKIRRRDTEMMHVRMNEERTRSGVSGCIWSGSEQFHESRGLQYASNMLRGTSIFARFFFFLLSFFPSFFSILLEFYWNFVYSRDGGGYDSFHR